MIIKFKHPTELEVVETYNEAADHWETSNETFTVGEVVEVDLLDQTAESADFQFGDGSVAFAVPKDCYEVMP